MGGRVHAELRQRGARSDGERRERADWSGLGRDSNWWRVQLVETGPVVLSNESG
jgi:hypothetical protein